MKRWGRRADLTDKNGSAGASPSRSVAQTSIFGQSLAVVLGLAVVAACEKQAAAPDRAIAAEDQSQFASPLHWSAWNEPGSWPQFAHDPLHSGRSQVDLQSADLELKWQFRPTDHVWTYKPGYAVFSSPVVGEVGGRTLVIAGHYDRLVYAVDGETGKPAWTFGPGACVFAAPALGRIDGRPFVFLAAVNRSIYAVDAATGEKQWSYETMPWSFSRSDSIMSSPTVIRDGERTVLLVGVWNGDRSSAAHVQKGELVALNAADGELIWRKQIATVPVTSPAVAKFDGRFVVFVAAHHGQVRALRLADGEVLWRRALNEETRSSPSIGLVGETARLVIGTRFHSVFSLEPFTGVRRWKKQTGYWIDATPAWFTTPQGPAVAAGSYDRSIYAMAADNGQARWKATTGNFAYSSAAIAQLAGRQVVIAMSWDEQVYLLDGADGGQLWEAASGPLIWSHVFQGDSLWASPAIAMAKGRPRVFVAAFDGVMYAYGPVDGDRGIETATE